MDGPKGVKNEESDEGGWYFCCQLENCVQKHLATLSYESMTILYSSLTTQQDSFSAVAGGVRRDGSRVNMEQQGSGGSWIVLVVLDLNSGSSFMFAL